MTSAFAPPFRLLLCGLLAAGFTVACAPPAKKTPPVVDELGLDHLSRAVDDGAFGNIAAVVVSKNGRIVFEDYFGSHTKDAPLDMRSVGKSLTALAIGVAIEEGSLDGLAQPVFASFLDRTPMRHDGPIKQGIRVGDLLKMRSPLDCTDWRDSPGNEERMYKRRDWTRFALDIPVKDVDADSAPFSYCTAGVFLLGQMLERETGEPFDAYVTDRIFAPLGIADVVWRRSPIGEVQSGGQIALRARDAERLGRLVLREGQWGGREIVSREWVRDILQPVSQVEAGLSYSMLWWATDFNASSDVPISASMMLGNGGNLVFVVPDLNAVIVVQATNYNAPTAFAASRALVESVVLPTLTAK